MMNTQFNEVKDKHMERLEQFTPIVERVHGDKHPEFFEVHTIFKQLSKKINEIEEDTNLDEEFRQLREVTNNYEVPSDVCESYEAVYMMLEDLDQAYLEK